MSQEVSKFGPNFDADGNYTGPESLTITFAKPIKLHERDENAVPSITLSEPDGAQMEAFQKEMLSSRNDFTAGCVLIHKNAVENGTPPAFTLAHAKKIKTRDFKRALDFLTGFIPPGPETGVS